MKDVIQYVNDEIAELKNSRDEEIRRRDEMLSEFEKRITNLDSKLSEAEQVLELHKTTSDAKDKTLVSAKVLEVFRSSNPDFVEGNEVRKYTDNLTTADNLLLSQKDKYSAYPRDAHKINEAIQEIDSTHAVAVPFIDGTELVSDSSYISEPIIDEIHNVEQVEVPVYDYTVFNQGNDLVAENVVQQDNSELDSVTEVDELLKNYVFDVSPTEGISLEEAPSFIETAPVEPKLFEVEEPAEGLTETPELVSFDNSNVMEQSNVSPTRQKVIAIEEVKEKTLGRLAA